MTIPGSTLVRRVVIESIGARREALRCVRAAARTLPARRTAGLLRAVLGRPVAQAQWA